MVKAAFFDLDWTLYDHRSKRWDLASIEAIKGLQSKGVKAFMATARPYASFVPFGALDLGIQWDGYVASSGGLAVLGDEVVFKTVVRKEDVAALITLCRHYHMTMELVGEKERRLLAPLTRSARAYYSVFHETVPSIKDFSIEAIALLLFMNKKYDARFRKAFPHLCFYRFFPDAVDVYEVPHRKGDGVEAIIKKLGISKDEAIGFGDDLQDIPMAEAVGTFVAMGNAKEEVKKCASFVTKEVWNEGVKAALEKLQLI